MASTRFVESHGLASIDGGRHAGHGTANRIVPLGRSYLSFVAVVDPDEAEVSAFGSWIAARAKNERPSAVGLAVSQIERIANRLDIHAMTVSRTQADGSPISYRVAGLPEALTNSTPFFIEWGIPEEARPGRTPAPHDVTVDGITVEISGDPERLRSWLGDAPEDLVVSRGAPGIARVVVSTSGGDVVL